MSGFKFDAKKFEKEAMRVAKEAAVKHETDLECPSCKRDMGKFVLGEVNSKTVECPHCGESIKVNVDLSQLDY